MTDHKRVFIWELLKTVWMLSSSSTLFILVFLFTLFSILPFAEAIGVGDTIEASGKLAEAIDLAAKGDFIRLLLMALIVSLSTNFVVILVGGKFLLNSATKPCILQTVTGQGIIRDVLRECWKDVHRERSHEG